MTNNQLTREENVQAVFDLKAGYTLGLADVEILKRVARMALAAMDSEPVAVVDIQRGRGDGRKYALCFTSAGHSLPDDVYNLYVAPQPAKGLELAGWQFKSVNGDWLGLIDEHGKNQAVHEGCEVREVFAMADGVNERDQVRREHAEWSQATFGNVGPIGPLKHLSKEALEAVAEPDDLSEWADMQFLLWDAQRRAGITDEQITLAMIEKLAVNKQRDWPEPKDGEPRLHIKEQPAPVVPDETQSRAEFEKWCTVNIERNKWHPEFYAHSPAIGQWAAWEACRAAMLNHPSSIQPNTGAAPGAEIKHPSTNSPAIPEGYVMVPKEPTAEMLAAAKEWTGLTSTAEVVYIKMLAAAAQEVSHG